MPELEEDEEEEKITQIEVMTQAMIEDQQQSQLLQRQIQKLPVPKQFQRKLEDKWNLCLG